MKLLSKEEVDEIQQVYKLKRELIDRMGKFRTVATTKQSALQIHPGNQNDIVHGSVLSIPKDSEEGKVILKAVEDYYKRSVDNYNWKLWSYGVESKER